MASLAVFILHSIIIAVMQTLQLSRYLIITNPCELMLESVTCFVMRYPAIVCTFLLTLLQSCIVIERAIALWMCGKYNSCEAKIGISFVAVSVVISVAVSGWSIGEEDFSQRYAYCSSSTSSVVSRQITLRITESVIAAVTIASIVILFILNNYAERRRRFDLQSSYQLRENASVIRLILPLSTFQTVVSGTVAMSGVLVNTFREKFSVVTYRTLFASVNKCGVNNVENSFCKSSEGQFIHSK
ncbi:hypothetical protein GCK32_004746 [Trichostrongylus colubriformis]|uniref:G protein-coupled receptor n=1 Tax=Trichostrongylus colubriformis TaxID=6319 RepID=A0AAN8FI36_TRICO